MDLEKLLRNKSSNIIIHAQQNILPPIIGITT